MAISESNKEKIIENPYNNANAFSRLFFWWMNDIFREGNKRELELTDLHTVPFSDSSEFLGDQLTRAWENELSQLKLNDENRNNGYPGNKDGDAKLSLLRAIGKVFTTRFMLTGILALLECLVLILQPIFLGLLIRYFATSEYSYFQGWLFAIGVSGSAIGFILLHHPFFFGVQRIGSQVRIACCSLIYRKALRLSQSALSQTTIGQMVNLLSNDVNRFDQSTIFLHYLWIGPIQTVIVTAILWHYFGPYCLVGVILLFLFVPFQSLMGRFFSKLRVQTAEKTDKRIRVMNEFLNGIRVIKMYAWEIPFSALVADSRKDEVKIIRKTSHLKAINMGVFFLSSKIIMFLTLLAYVSSGGILTAEKVFVTLCLFNNIRVVVTLFIPNAVSQLAEALVSVKRLQTFLLLEERNCILKKCDDTLDAGSIKLENFSGKWNSSYEENTLSDISLEVGAGELISVIGHVGSGKSTLLHAILREFPPITGKVSVSGSIGYTAQEPWIFAGTVKENILFGKYLDIVWYDKVLNACAMKRDLSILPYGDSTLIGDRGTSLSGGQKARLALCRAVYANADIYLLDDPLSAVDPEVGRHIFEKCINGILKCKTRILVTHQLQLLKSVDSIVLMSDGKIQLKGSYKALIESGINFAQLLTNLEVSSENSTPLKKSGRRVPGLRQRTVSEGSEYSIARYESLSLGENSLLGPMCSREEIYEDAMDNLPEITLTPRRASLSNGKIPEEAVEFLPKAVEESKSTGQVPLSIYWKYFRSGSSYFTLFLLIITNLITQFLFTGSDYWLNVWTKAEEAKDDEGFKSESSINNDTNTSTIIEASMDQFETRDYYVISYSVIVGVFSVISMIRTIIFFKVCMDASVKLHNESFCGIVRAPMRFFEVNPLGRVLNRFSKDLGCIDDALPICFYDAYVIFMNVIGIMVLIGIVNPILLLPGTVLAILFVYLRQYYLNTARSVKRLEGIVRSPVFSHLSASLYGLTTIRACGVEEEFIKQFDRHQNLHSSAWFLFISTGRWFGLRLDVLSTVFISIVTFSFMFASGSGSGPAVGLAISSVMVLSGMFQWGVRQSAEVSNQMISVERVLDYADLSPEALLESTPDKKPPSDWPKYGEITFTKVSLKYGEELPVLQNLTFVIKPCEKLGIVGRTGAGKSSIISALFRLVEPTGQINIDGVNVLEIGLHDLRSKISIIPQEPVLFNGTVRKNLDPFSTYTDLEVWSVLEKVHLSETVKEIPGGLESQIAEGGSNFSLGERQLMCLGRAILQKNKILVLDEATANVDPETDGLIQKTIREMFKECTVLTIAHRLNTVMDSDRILVLDAGRVKELDEPYNLLQDQNSAFYHLVQETGSAAADNFFKIAKEVHENRKS